MTTTSQILEEVIHDEAEQPPRALAFSRLADVTLVIAAVIHLLVAIGGTLLGSYSLFGVIYNGYHGGWRGIEDSVLFIAWIFGSSFGAFALYIVFYRAQTPR